MEQPGILTMKIIILEDHRRVQRAVALGLVPLALGSDGGGSIRIPAALFGCVGLKATFKRIPIDCNLAPSLVHVGPIAGSITDAAYYI